MSSIIAFYDPKAQQLGSSYKSLLRILSWDNEELERIHDYIQYLFPLPESSPINPGAWTINREVFDAFRNRADLRDQLRKSLALMARFYGFKVIWPAGNDISLSFAPELDESSPSYFHKRAKVWVKPMSHNHLRITRIIRCLRVLGLEIDARNFYNNCMEVARLSQEAVDLDNTHDEYDPTTQNAWAEVDFSGTRAIGRRSQEFWTRAMDRPLWLRPDMEDHPPLTRRTGWLWEWEKEEL